MLRLSALVLSSVVPEIRRQPESHVEVSRLFLFFSLFAGSKFIAFTPQDRQPPLSPSVCHVALPSWNVSPFGHGLHHNIVDNSCYCFFFFGSAEKTFGLCRLVYLKTKKRYDCGVDRGRGVRASTNAPKQNEMLARRKRKTLGKT